MKPLAPCKDCDERYLGCHDSCKKYIEFKKKNDEFNTKRHKERMLDKIASEKLYF